MKIENIIINGCSFVHGFDLCYKDFNIPPFTSWPNAFKQFTDEQKQIFKNKRLSGKLGDIFNCNVIDLSISGECNDHIANSLIDYLKKNENSLNPDTTLVIVGWTEPERWPFFVRDNGENLNINVRAISYWKYAFQREQPKTKELESRIEVLNSLEGMEKLWEKYDGMGMTGYWRHSSLIFLLQQYLENHKYNYCFFNSLYGFPVNPKYPRYSNIGYDEHINWKNWYPRGDIKSYDWNWNSLILKHEKYKTDSAHPSQLAVDEFSKELAVFIKNNY